MISNRTNRTASLLAVAGCVVGIVLVAYVAGYFVLGRRPGMRDFTYRDFEYQWLCTIYRPAAIAEARISDPRGVVMSNASPPNENVNCPGRTSAR